MRIVGPSRIIVITATMVSMVSLIDAGVANGEIAERARLFSIRNLHKVINVAAIWKIVSLSEDLVHLRPT